LFICVLFGHCACDSYAPLVFKNFCISMCHISKHL